MSFFIKTKDKMCLTLKGKGASSFKEAGRVITRLGVSGGSATKWSASPAKESTPKCNINGYLAQRRLNLDYETYFRDNAPK